MTIAVGVLVEIVLMILLGSVEVLQWLLLYDERLTVAFLLLLIYLFYYRQIVGIYVVDACPVACPFIMPLPVKTGRVNGLEEHPLAEILGLAMSGLYLTWTVSACPVVSV